MAYTSQKDFKALEARVAALEEMLGSDDEVPTIEQELTLAEVYGEDLAQILSHRYTTATQVKLASDDDLRSISGIGPARLAEIRAKE